MLRLECKGDRCSGVLRRQKENVPKTYSSRSSSRYFRFVFLRSQLPSNKSTTVRTAKNAPATCSGCICGSPPFRLTTGNRQMQRSPPASVYRPSHPSNYRFGCTVQGNPGLRCLKPMSLSSLLPQTLFSAAQMPVDAIPRRPTAPEPQSIPLWPMRLTERDRQILESHSRL